MVRRPAARTRDAGWTLEKAVKLGRKIEAGLRRPDPAAMSEEERWAEMEAIASETHGYPVTFGGAHVEPPEAA